jgi:regulator of protease activity HflC (stomatin/prohibitin superfamily)
MAAVLAILTLLVGGALGALFFESSPNLAYTVWFITILVAIYVAYAVRIATQWEKQVVLRLGKYNGLKGPGLFFIIPILDSIPYVIDLRTRVSSFDAKQTLTRDNVPVDVDAILFWQVIDAEKAALEVEDYWSAVTQAAQTSLRDVIGRTELSQMLAGRETIGTDLKNTIDKRTEGWGVDVSSVEIKDVIIPATLQDAMSRQAQAERERQARVILGDSENQIADKFAEAAKKYAGDPAAMHLRAMNMLYEGLKDKGALIIVPSSAVDSMNLGGMMGLASLSKQVKPEKGEGKE